MKIVKGGGHSSFRYALLTRRNITSYVTFFVISLVIALFSVFPLLSVNATSDASEHGDAYISGLRVRQIIDGTAPFDDDDTSGNDSSDDNLIVRSFDELTYIVEYTTALSDLSHVVNEADLSVTIELPISPKRAQFNTDAMQWLENASIVYTYQDGTTSTDDWSVSKEVVKQTITGTRHLKNVEANAIPGTGTLSIGISVKAALDKTQIQPSITIGIIGDDRSLDTKVDIVTVSAKPKYDASVSYNSQQDYYGYFNLDDGSVSKTGDNDGVRGRADGVNLALRLFNDNQTKGLRGIELPSGDISFDLSFSVVAAGVDVTDRSEYQPVLWDYRDANNQTTGNGKLGRTMYMSGMAQATTAWQYPNNASSSSRKSVPGGGNFTITENGDATYRVTVSNYDFDWKNFHFPDQSVSATTDSPQYGDNIGYFSVGYLIEVFQFPEDPVISDTTIEDLQISAIISNFDMQSEGGTDASDVLSSNNIATYLMTIYDEGNIQRDIRIIKNDAVNADIYNSAGTSFDSPGAKNAGFLSYVYYKGDDYLRSFNLLQKFDDECWDVSASTYRFPINNPMSKEGDVLRLFAAKPDKTGWVNDNELVKTREEQLVYFTSYDELIGNGYTCVGILYEVRDAELYEGDWNVIGRIETTGCTIRDDVINGNVYAVSATLRAWHIDDDPPNICDYQISDSAYGIANPNLDALGEYEDGYIHPYFESSTGYTKTQYDEGRVVGGHTGGWQMGNSLLIVAAQNKIGISVSSEIDGNETSVFDLDNGQRTAYITVSPSFSIVSANIIESMGDIHTDLTITVELPNGLHYDASSASIAPTSVDENVDGTTSMTFVIRNVKAGDSIPSISMSATIGNAGSADDVENNASFVVIAEITSDADRRIIRTECGNIDETSFSVIRLSATSVNKSVEYPIMPMLSENSFTLRISNSFDDDISDAVIFDVLPYDTDANGSSFSGRYRITGISFDLSNAPRMFASLDDIPFVSYTTDVSARSTDPSIICSGGSGINMSSIGTADVNGTSLVFDNLDINDAAALLFDVGTIYGNEYISVRIDIDFADADNQGIRDDDGNVQQPSDVYANSFYEWSPNQPAIVQSNVVKTTVADPSIELKKDVDKTTIENDDDVVGTLLQYNFLITNTGNVTLTDVSFTDELVGLTDLTFSWNDDDNHVLVPGQTVSGTASYQITQYDIDKGNVSNVASVSAVPEIGDVVNDTDTAETQIDADASISLVKNTPSEEIHNAAVGTTIPFTFKITNTGNVTLHDITLTDHLDDIYDVVIDWATSTDDATDDGVLSVGESVGGTAKYDLTQANIDKGSVTNTATTEGISPLDEKVSDDDDVIVHLDAPSDVKLTKTVDIESLTGEDAVAGKILTYTFDVENTGKTTLKDVRLVDHLHGMQGQGIDWSTHTDAMTDDGVLSPNEHVFGTMTYELTQADIDAGTINNSASVYAVSPHGAIYTSDDVAGTTAETYPSISLVKTAGTTKISGDDAVSGYDVEWFFELTNTGNVTLTDIDVEDYLDGTSDIDYGNWNRTLVPGASHVVAATYKLTQTDIDAGKVTNTAIAHSKSPDGVNVDSNESTVDVIIDQSGGLTIEKHVDKEMLRGNEAVAGATLTYTFDVVNAGNVTLHDVNIEDYLDGVNDVAIDWDNSSDASTEEGVLSPSEKVGATATYIVTQDDVDSGSVLNTAIAHGIDVNDSSVDSNESSVLTEIEQHTELLLDKQVDKEHIDPANVGDVLTYTFVITNKSNVTLTDLTMTDELDGISSIKFDWDSSTDDTTDTNTLSPDESITGTATYSITQADIDACKVTNTAVAHMMSAAGGNVDSNEDTVETMLAVESPELTQPDDTDDGNVVSEVVETITETLSQTGIANGLKLVLLIAAGIASIAIWRKMRK